MFKIKALKRSRQIGQMTQMFLLSKVAQLYLVEHALWFSCMIHK